MAHPAQSPNFFDNLQINVEEVYATWPLDRAATLPLPRHRFAGLYRSPLPFSWRNALWHALHRTQLDQAWFDDFSVYWSRVLGGRPLWGPEDLYFLKNWYRIKFQSLAVDDTEDAAEHLAAWQRPEALYQLLHYVYKGSRYHDAALLARAKARAGRFTSFMEYGCGVAPVTVAQQTFFASPKVRVVITDIPTLAFHFAALTLGQQPNIKAVALSAEDEFAVPAVEPVDVIFCLTVFEHLRRPLETIKSFLASLTPGGLLVFDYFKGKGEGLDTEAAVRDRDAVIRFIGEHFTVAEGSLSALDEGKICMVRRPR
jgi:SAM-dependent methyltransferase